MNRVYIHGLDKLIRKTILMPRALETNYVKAMYKTVLFVKKEAQSMTPIRTGNLRASSRSLAKRKRDGSKGKVWYNAHYAIPVHERTWTKLISGQHKFLEKAVRESRKHVSKMIAEEIKRGLGGFSG